jgi:hypothetical protein
LFTADGSLDEQENAARYEDEPPTSSYNYDDTGFFSISVLEKVGTLPLGVLTPGLAGVGPDARPLARRGHETVPG